MKTVSCQDTKVSKKERHMSAREALLHDRYSKLAAAKEACEELHDDNELTTYRYMIVTREISLCMAIIDELISTLQQETELNWTHSAADDAYAAYLRDFAPEGHTDCGDHDWFLRQEMDEPKPLKKSLPNVDKDKLYIPSGDTVFEITRLRVMAP